jgi:hypothetical protein
VLDSIGVHSEIMAPYLLPGIEISIAVSLVAGIVIGAAMGFAGLTSRWLFRAEILSFLIGGTVVVITQSALTVIAGLSLGLRVALFISLMFILSEPAIVLLAVSTAVAIGYLTRKIT